MNNYFAFLPRNDPTRFRGFFVGSVLTEPSFFKKNQVYKVPTYLDFNRKTFEINWFLSSKKVAHRA
jgi:hypothetical protein